jgi:hypothetical protein
MLGYSSCFTLHPTGVSAALLALLQSEIPPCGSRLAAAAHPSGFPSRSRDRFFQAAASTQDKSTTQQKGRIPLHPANMSAGNVVFISGATGPRANAINGCYDGTREISGGYALYSKRGDPSMCIEHHGGEWQVKDVSSKGKSACKANVKGGCALEDCASRVWRVSNGNGFDDQHSVKMAIGREAERQVGCCCLRAHAHARDAAAPHSRARVAPCDALRFCTVCGACGG